MLSVTVPATATGLPFPPLLPPDLATSTLLSTAQLLDLLGGREMVEATIEGLIRLLDDNDAPEDDLEDGADDEPSLGAPETQANQAIWFRGSDDDREFDDADHEPTLGAPERHPRVLTMSDPWFDPGDGSRRVTRSPDARQTHWWAGSNRTGNNDGEPEAGYDLPEGDEEWDGRDAEAPDAYGLVRYSLEGEVHV